MQHALHNNKNFYCFEKPPQPHPLGYLRIDKSQRAETKGIILGTPRILTRIFDRPEKDAPTLTPWRISVKQQVLASRDKRRIKLDTVTASYIIKNYIIYLVAHARRKAALKMAKNSVSFSRSASNTCGDPNTRLHNPIFDNSNCISCNKKQLLVFWRLESILCRCWIDVTMQGRYTASTI